MRRLLIFLFALALLGACSRGPDEAALKADVQSRIEKNFKPGLLELAALKRQGSSPQSAAPCPSASALAMGRVTSSTLNVFGSERPFFCASRMPVGSSPR